MKPLFFNSICIVSASLGFVAGSVSAFAAGEDELSRYLNEFYQDTPRVMNRIPPKKDENGRVVGHSETPFSTAAEKAIYYRGLGPGPGLRYLEAPAPYAQNDRVENLVEVPTIYRTLDQMESAQLQSQALARKPWSDSYWPVAQGMIATRYADTAFPASEDWTANFAYISQTPALPLFAAGTSDNLAPSEKYDYLMGDDQGTLTAATWDYAKSKGTVAGWEGICDGWSASSIYYDEPLQAVQVTGASGRTVRFFPSDINALSSVLWSKGVYPTRFIGSRCTTVDPPTDAVGRILTPECGGSNPGTWHMAVVNQLGQAKRAMVIDASSDPEIWNYPLWSYSYTYFNPQTLRPAQHWSDAVVSSDRFAIDKFKSYRSPEARYVAGISMDITYMIENVPSHLLGPHASPRTVHYVYDLELDSNFEIVGGEWYTNLHPNFLWTPKVGARAVSVVEDKVGDPSQWPGTTAPPDGWTGLAQNASQHLQPLAAVVDRLVRLSHDAVAPQ